MMKLFPGFLLLSAMLLSCSTAAYSTGREQAGSAHDAGKYRALEVSLKVASNQAVLAYLRSPGKAALEEALKTCLATRENISADLYNDFLIAFCRHELGDAAGEAAALSAYPSEQRDMYRYIFYEHRAELADSLYLLPAYLCAKLRETARARKAFPEGAKCPSFGGPITSSGYKRGGRVLYKFSCARCDAMLGLEEKKSLGNLLLRAKDNTLNSLLIQVAHGLDDRRSFKGEKVEIIPRLVSLLGIRKGQVVGDIGCGIGQFTFPVARLVGGGGKVYAEDIDPNAVNLVKYCAEKGGLKNIVPVLGSPEDTGIPAGALDTALLFHVYRGIIKELDPAGLDAFLDSFFASIRKTLKKGGTLVVVDNIDPAFDVTAEKVAAALDKRGFRLLSDRSDARSRRLVLLFKQAALAPPRGPR
jgi:SAM-dependent methyltransferase